MKRISIIGIIAFASILSIGCSNNTVIDDPNTNSPISVDTVPPRTLSIIKLPLEIQDLVFVTPIVDSIVLDAKTYNITLYYDNGLVLYNPTQSGEDLSKFALTYLNLAGSSPYLILDNGYAIVDWKWSYFQPLSGAYRDALYPYRDVLDQNAYNIWPSYSVYGYPITNEQYYVLNLRWDELSDLSVVWDLQEGNLIETPELRSIRIDDIKLYADEQESYPEPSDLQSLYRLYTTDTVKCRKAVDEYDKSQAYYVEILNRMINNNDFDKWTLIRNW